MNNKDDNNYIYYVVGKNIRKYRKLKHWTQRVLAEKCNLSENYICDLENETFKTISLNTLYLISKVLNVNIKNLFDDIN
jgi:transcriptional regulator with XRE-family HTH domain